MNSGGPKFSVGDLVVFKHEIAEEMISELGIIVSNPTLMFSHQWPNQDVPENFWSYDIKAGNSLFKMIPEEFLRRLKDDNEEHSE